MATGSRSPLIAALAAILAFAGCASTGSPDLIRPVPRGSPDLVPELRALRALEGMPMTLEKEPPPAALRFCKQISADPNRWICEIQITELRFWTQQIVAYAREIEALRGWPECPRWRRVLKRCA